MGQPKRAPSQGWRKWLYCLVKLINVGESPKVKHINKLVHPGTAAASGLLPDRAASWKGGVGKKTVNGHTWREVRSIRGEPRRRVDDQSRPEAS